MRTMDVLFSFPVILLAIALVAVFGPSLRNTMIAIGIVFTPIFARVVRGSVLSVREEVYILAVRSLGATDRRIVLRHVLPNVAAPIIVQASLSAGVRHPDGGGIVVTSASACSLRTPRGAAMLSDAQRFLAQGWWLSFFPGAAIFLTVMAFNVVGDGLRDALDPKQRSVIESRGRDGGDASTGAVLSVRDLEVRFATKRGIAHVVRGLSYDLHAGETLAIVGESGSGKSVSTMALTKLLPMPPGRIGGTARLDGVDLLTLSEKQLLAYRGQRIGYVFQDPMTSLNPVHTIGRQLTEGMRFHLACPRRTHVTGLCSCCARSASRTPRSGSTTIRTSSRAGCANGW